MNFDAKSIEYSLGELVVTPCLLKFASGLFNLAHDEVALIGEDWRFIPRQIPQRDPALLTGSSEFACLERQSSQQQTTHRGTVQERGRVEKPQCRQAVAASFAHASFI